MVAVYKDPGNLAAATAAIRSHELQLALLLGSW